MRLVECNKIDQLVSCTEELNTLGPDTEAEFLSIGNILNRLADICFGMTDDARQLTAISSFSNDESETEGGSFVEDTRNVFKEIVRHVETSIESLGGGEQLLTELSRQLRMLNAPIEVLYTIGKTFRVLGVCVKVESSRCEGANKGFKLLAEEVSQIANLVQENCRFCLGKSNQVMQIIATSQPFFNSSANTNDGNAEKAILYILDTLEDVGSKVEILSRGIQERSAEMVEGIGEVVLAMQFHDITRQQLENVSKALLEVDTTVQNSSESGAESTDEQDALEVYTILSIQAAHLNSIYEQILCAGKQIETGLGKAMDHAQKQAQDARILLNKNDGSGQMSVVLNLEKEIDQIVHSLNESLAVVQHAADSSRDVHKNVSEIGAFVNKIEAVAFDVKILAINAMVEATKAGKTGKPLIVLAEELSNLSQKTKDGADNSIDTLQHIIKGTEKQLEFATDLARKRDGVDTMLDEVRTLTGTILTSMQEVSDLANKMDAASIDLSSRIVRLLPEIRFPEQVGGLIEKNWQLLCDIINHIEEEYPQFLEKTAAVEEMLEELSEKYVMDRERSIHFQVTRGQVVADNKEDDFELFGDDMPGENDVRSDDNIELF